MSNFSWFSGRGRKLKFILAGVILSVTAYIHFSADRIRERITILWGTFTAAAGALSLGDLAIIVGIICTIGSFLVTWYYKAKDDKRKDQIFREGRVTDE